MNPCDCLFVFPPGGEYDLESFSYALGSGYVIAYLRAQGISASQFYSEDYLGVEECAVSVLKRSPRIVGFTVFNTNFIPCLLIAEKIKSLSPGIVVVFGGPAASSYARFITGRYACVDVCVRNEGEEIFHELVVRLARGRFRMDDCGLDDLRAITYRQGHKVRHNPDADILIHNSHTDDFLDKYPSPYLSGVIPPEKAWTTGVITARGCNQNCVYCNCAVLSKRKFSTHSIGRVVSEIECLSRHVKPNQLMYIFDDAFTLLPNRAKQICRAIAENGIKINLGCITRCDCMDEELLDLMKAAGFLSVGFSLESAVPRILRIIGKVRPAEDVPSGSLEREERFVEKLAEMAAYAKKIGIPNIYSSIIVGLPTETAEEANRTVDCIDSIPSIDVFNHNLLYIYHGTPLHDTYRKYDYRIANIGRVPLFGKMKYLNNVPSQARISKKSNLQRRREQFERHDVKILALHPQRKSSGWCFQSVIVNSNRLSKEAVEWMKEAVAIGAPILQLYSSRTQYQRHADENSRMVYRHYSPSTRLHNYYLAEKSGYRDVVSYFSIGFRDEDSADHLKMGNTAEILKRYESGGTMTFDRVVCHDETPEDTRSLLGLLKELSGSGRSFEVLSENRRMPFFSGLCRWSTHDPNCETLETAILDGRGNIRLCWQGVPVGTVRDSFRAIRNRVECMRAEARDSRQCAACAASDRCIQCCMTEPIPVREYCAAVQANDLGKSADLLRSFHLLDEYLNR